MDEAPDERPDEVRDDDLGPGEQAPDDPGASDPGADDPGASDTDAPSHPAVDEVLRSLERLGELPVEEHVATFERAHEDLRRTLTDARDRGE